MTPGQDVPGYPSEPWSAPGLDLARERIRGTRPPAGFSARARLTPFPCVIRRAPWKVLVELVRAEGGVVGALVVARQGRVWARWERSLVKAFGAVLTQGATLAHA